MKERTLIINNIKLPTNASAQEAFAVSARKLKQYSALPQDAEYRIYRRSVDARRKSEICYVYSVAVSGSFGKVSEKVLSMIGASFECAEEPVAVFGDEPLSAPPVIVGSGPCGLFCALMLAEEGYSPVILERGGDVSERVKAIDSFIKTRVLDTSTNIQFGAGGAGTFSDGKLVTRINDGLCAYVLRRFVEFGAPEEILYLAKPHIGTDVLMKVVQNILDRIESLGGKICYHTRFIATGLDRGRINRVQTSSGDIEAGALVLAIGHSARDTYEELMTSGVAIEGKNFSVGMRIEHLAEDIDRAMYGDMAGAPGLGHAEYNLSHNTKQRGVYTFCMCPGGEVVAAASEYGGVVVNGMSRHARDGKNSNSAVVCSIFKEDYGCEPKKAIEFQRKIEKSAYEAGGRDYSAPIILLSDFFDGKLKTEPGEVVPTYMGGTGVKLASPYDYLPEIVCDGIKNAIIDFDKKIHGFAKGTSVLTGAETRTSAPIRILRNSETGLGLGFENLYPAGEGAGYAGGITSAAIDGVRCALALMKKYKRN